MMAEKLKILVVDDNKNFCRNVTDILELGDYEVVSAYDGFKALEMVKENGFDMVLMDIRMPGMDGVETFKKIKEVAPTTAVIMVTAYAVEDLIREALREGAFGALRKPVDFDQFMELIEKSIPNGKLILVVDDDESFCANLQDVLSDKGYRVSVSYDSKTAVDKARENNFDIMLIDLRLNGVNGLETYRSIRDFRPKAVAIIITGYPQEMDKMVQQALQENVYACLVKPVDMDKLVSLLDESKQQKARGMPKKPE